MSQPLPIKKEKLENGTFYVPESYFREWVIKREFPQFLVLGCKTVVCKMAPHPDKKEEFLLSEDLWDTLLIPHEGPVHLFQQGNFLYIGPLIGIFTAGFTDNKLRPVGDRSMLFAKLLSVERKVGAYYFMFGPHHINWEESTINGLFYTSKGWIERKVPIPSVIYNRLPNRKTENLESLKSAMDRFERDFHIPIFNPSFFNKWEIHHSLLTDPKVSHYLPETYLDPDSSQIEDMLARHSNLYLKPAKGSLGQGIQQILKRGESYYCRFRLADQNRLRRYSSLNRLLLRQYPSGKLKSILVQQGINLLKWNDKAIDFRIHTNKDENGKWVVSAMAAKIAGSGSVTTHIANGGEVKTIQEIIHEMGKTSEMLNRLKEAALEISESIDQVISGIIGEIGFDLGIDTEGRVWLFEANSKPGRSIFSHPSLRSHDLLSRTLPLKFAIYLMKQSIAKRKDVVRS